MTMRFEQEIDRMLSRRERERLTRKREIIAAARDLFAARGFADATLDEIAVKAEFGKGTIYNYFESKDELLDAVLHDSLEELLALAEDACGDAGATIMVCYRRLARAILTYVFAHREFFILMTREIHRPAHHAVVQTTFPRIIDVLARPLLRALPSGTADESFARRIAYVFLTQVVGLMHTRIHADFIGCPVAAAVGEESSGDHGRDIEDILGILEVTFFRGIESVVHPGSTAP